MTKTRHFSLNALTSFDLTFSPETIDRVIIHNSRAAKPKVCEVSQHVQIDDLVFAVGAKWHSFVTQNERLRGLLLEMQTLFPAPAIA